MISKPTEDFGWPASPPKEYGLGVDFRFQTKSMRENKNLRAIEALTHYLLDRWQEKIEITGERESNPETREIKNHRGETIFMEPKNPVGFTITIKINGGARPEKGDKK